MVLLWGFKARHIESWPKVILAQVAPALFWLAIISQVNSSALQKLCPSAYFERFFSKERSPFWV